MNVWILDAIAMSKNLRNTIWVVVPFPSVSCNREGIPRGGYVLRKTSLMCNQDAYSLGSNDVKIRVNYFLEFFDKNEGVADLFTFVLG
jgi:hypothetical protein